MILNQLLKYKPILQIPTVSPQNIIFPDPEQKEITFNAYLLLKYNIEKGDLNRPEMKAKLLCSLETSMHRAMKEKQYSAITSNAKALINLFGLEAKVKSQIG